MILNTNWVLIGTELWGKYQGDIPNWVKNFIDNKVSPITRHDLSHENKYLVITGKHFEYKILPKGQGGESIYVYRKPRNWLMNKNKKENLTKRTARASKQR